MYISYFGLNKNPFETTPDPHFFYNSSDHKEAMSAIHYGVENDKGLIVICGDVGTGKTTLIKTYLENLPSEVVPIYIDYPFSSMDQLTLYLAEKLGIDSSKCATFIGFFEAIKEKLIKMSKEGKKLVLIIDEAQHLDTKSLEHIRLLSNLQTSDKKLLNIILVGQTELLDKINSPELRQLRQRVVIQRFLKPFSLDDTKNYITHRLLVAGSYTNLFDKSAIKLIYGKSKGIPRLINRLCDNALLGAYVARKNIVNAGIVRRVLKEESWRSKKHKLRTGLAILGVIVASLIVVFSVIFNKGKEASRGNYVASSDMLKAGMSFKVEENPFEEMLPLEEKENGSPSEDIDFSLEIEKEMAKDIQVSLKNIGQGEVLHKILLGAYGKSNDTLIDIVQQFNPSIKDVNLIYPGDVIKLPKIFPEHLIVQNKDGKYLIHYYSSFQSASSYRKLQEISKFNQPVFVLPVEKSGKVVYRVYVGPFSSSNEAKAFLLKLPRDHLPF